MLHYFFYFSSVFAKTPERLALCSIGLRDVQTGSPSPIKGGNKGAFIVIALDKANSRQTSQEDY